MSANVSLHFPQSGAPTWRDPVSTATALPSTGMLGEVRVAQDTQINYTWGGSAWVAPSGGGGSGITALTGDVTASGTGSVAATVASIGGKTAAAVATVVTNTSGTNTGDQTISLTGPITGSGTGSFATAIASQTGTGTKFVMDTAPTITGLLTQTGQYTNSFAGTASNSAMFFSGSPFSGGSGTTNRPAVCMEDAATPSTTWSGAGTYIGVNAISTFTGDLINLSKAGTTEFQVGASGAALFRGTVQCAQVTVGVTGIITTGNNATLILGSTRTFSTADQLQAATSTNNGSAGAHAGLAIIPTYNQTLTAGGTDLLINRTETAIGSGTHLLIDAQVGSASKFNIDRTGAISNAAPQTTLTGSAGTALCNQPFKGSTYKKVVVFLNGYTDTGTQTYTFPTAFTNTPFIYGLTAGVSGATVTATTIKFTVTTLTGFVILEGY